MFNRNSIYGIEPLSNNCNMTAKQPYTILDSSLGVAYEELAGKSYSAIVILAIVKVMLSSVTRSPVAPVLPRVPAKSASAAASLMVVLT